MSVFEIDSTQLQEWLGNYSLKFALTEYGDVMDIDKNAMIAEFVQNLNVYLNKEVAYHQKQQASIWVDVKDRLPDDETYCNIVTEDNQVLPAIYYHYKEEDIKYFSWVSELDVKDGVYVHTGIEHSFGIYDVKMWHALPNLPS